MDVIREMNGGVTATVIGHDLVLAKRTYLPWIN
jgi:hypothetical protein